MRLDIFEAIADPARRAIIVLIALQAMTSNALAEHFDITRQAVSKYLRILTVCEPVTQKPQGREIYYELQLGKMKEIDKWLEYLLKIRENRFDQLDTVLKKLKNKKQ
jgi:DNA-binding transcriptional ArsR family regulator